MIAEVDYARVDSLVANEQLDESRRLLMDAYETSNNKESVELLWRLARTLYFISADDKKKHKELMYEGIFLALALFWLAVVFAGQKFAVSGHELCPDNFECLRWASILTGSISDISGHKEKIQQGNLFKVSFFTIAVLIINT